MKYIRTKDGIYEIVDFDDKCIIPCPIIRMNGRLTHCSDYKELLQADTIEELCDEFVVVIENKPHLIPREWLKQEIIVDVLYGVIWTDKGLIYIAKMNDKGELELL